MFEWFWKFVYYLLVGITGLVDFILDVFRVLCGLAKVTINGQKEDLLTYFLTSDTINTAFWLVAFIGIGLLFLATIFMMIRLQYDNRDGQNTPARVIGKAGKAFLLFSMVPLIMGIMSLGVSTVMGQIDMATNPYYEQIAEDPSFDGYGRTSIGGQILVTIGEDAWVNSDLTEDDKKLIRASFIMNKEGYNYLDYDDVSFYYDVSELQFSVGFISAIVFLIIFALAMFRVAERLVNILVLYIISPMPIAVSVLDDGQRFKLWRDQVLIKFLSAYGVIISLNVYNLIVPVIQNMSFGVPFYGNDSPQMIAYTDGLIKIYLLLGAAFAIYKAPIMIGNLISQGAGSQEAADTAHSNQLLGRMGHMAMGAARTVATPLTATAAYAKKQAGTSIMRGIERPLNNARDRKDQIARMKSDAKMHDKMEKAMKNVREKGDKASHADRVLVDSYQKQKEFAAPGGMQLKPDVPNTENKEKVKQALNKQSEKKQNTTENPPPKK